MGGYGSGRHFYHEAKATTSSYLSMDIRRWKRERLLTSNNSFTRQWQCEGKVVTSINVDVATDLGSVTLHYRNEVKNFNYQIPITWVECNLGGRRPWFICPVKICARRVAILYGGSVFACRHCYNLAYQCQRETIGDRASRQAEKIRDKLKWMPGILNGEEWKPKGMHWKTFERLYARHDDLVQIALLEARLRFGSAIDDFL
jgi:hypothetical protein